MIHRRDAEQCFECSICGELLEYQRSHARDPEVLLNMRDEFAAEHKGCERFADDPARARAEREYQAGMRREMGRALQKHRGPRCNGAPELGTGNRGRTSFRTKTN